MNREQAKSPDDHHKAMWAAGAGAAVVAATAISFGYRAWHRRRSELLNSNISGQEDAYHKQLEILSESLPKPELLEPVDQTLLANMSVRVYEATVNTTDGVTTCRQLAEQLGVSIQSVAGAMVCLRRSGLVLYSRKSHGTKQSGRKPGFYASEALFWGITEGDNEPLQQAMSDLVMNLNDSSYSSEESLDPER